MPPASPRACHDACRRRLCEGLLPVEVLAGTYSSQGIRVCECREDADPEKECHVSAYGPQTPTLRVAWWGLTHWSSRTVRVPP